MRTEPRIETVAEKKLVGKSLIMSLTNNRTGKLWQSFIARRNEIQNAIGSVLYSMRVYQPIYFQAFSPAKKFEKWAAIEVKDFDYVPVGIETYTLLQGLYAVFHYRGASTDASIYQYIFATWLPNSRYILDNRPHFEMLGEKYANGDPNSEEDIYIPIKPKNDDSA